MELVHDEISLSEESSTLEQCPTSTEQNSSTEDMNTGVSSPSATEDGTTAMASLPMQSRDSVDKVSTHCTYDDEINVNIRFLNDLSTSCTMKQDGAAEGQVLQSAALESSTLKPDGAAPEDDGYKEAGVQFARSCVYLQDAELNEHDAHLASIAFSLGDQPEEARGADMQNQVADTMQDSSAKEPDGTPEPTAGDTNIVDYVSTATAENSVQSPLLEETSQSDSALQQFRLQEWEAVKPCEVSCKEDPALVDQPNDARLENPVGSFSIGEKHEAVSLEKEAKTMEDTVHVASHMCGEPGMPDSVRNREDVTMLRENPTDSKMSLESQSHSQNESVSGDVGIQIASEEAATVSATHGAVDRKSVV